MTTLATDTPRTHELGAHSHLPVVAADIVFEGSAVGLEAGTGHARPLVAGDRFVGFAQAQADNSGGAAADKYVHLVVRGQVVLPVAGAAITDVGQPVYASDDATFSFNPADGSFVGFVKRYVSDGVAAVAFDAQGYRDPWGHLVVRETLSATKTFDAEDTGKLFCVDAAADGDALTLPAVADGLQLTLLAVGAFGSTALTVSPDAADMIRGPDIDGAADKDLVLTKATQRRGDFVQLASLAADGYAVAAVRGTWVRET